MDHPVVAPQQHAAHTRDALRLPGAPSVTTVEGRRWRDLHVAYAEQLGERARREDVRLLLRALIALTLRIEQQEATIARGEAVDASVLVQGTQLALRLLAELGLSSLPDEDEAPIELALLDGGARG